MSKRRSVALTLALVTIAAGYLAVLFIVSQIYYGTSIGNDPRSAATFAVPIVILPYVVGGVFLGLFSKAYDAKLALVAGLIATIGERLLILALAAWTLGGFRQLNSAGEIYYVEGGPDLLGAIQSEALPYFTWAYILLGIPVSILALLVAYKAVAWLRQRQRAS
ncbi:MAG: hypothetical protein H6649_03730 [Caldilineae bacterium]|nr:hypothetical protein [Anaerolineae bacterium]MCB9153153.1 hypothetical protein [Caldilineae bacterium]